MTDRELPAAALRAVADAVGDQDLLDRTRAQLPSDLQRLLPAADAGDTSALQSGA
jgi:hypothetical protein